jgi:hypothetical protein
MDEDDAAAEVNDKGEDVDDAALATQLADEDMAMEDDMEGTPEGKCYSHLLC